MGVWKAYKGTLGKGSTWLSQALGKLGFFVAHRPIIVLVSTTVVSLALASGLIVRLRQETASERIWYVFVPLQFVECNSMFSKDELIKSWEVSSLA